MAKDSLENAMEYMEEHEEDTIVLEFDDPESEGGVVEVECDIIGVFDAEYNGATKEYIALSPVENSDDAEYPYDIIDIADDAELEFAIKEFDSLMDELEKEHKH